MIVTQENNSAPDGSDGGIEVAHWPLGKSRAYWAVGVLGALYIVSFIDRLILALLIAPLQAELHVTDTQLSLLYGPAFAVFYAFLGLPVARIADRRNRRRLIAAGVFLWAAATIGSAFAPTYGWLIALRFGLAIGEAVLTPAAFSLIRDYFPPRERRLAASIYSALGTVGAPLAFILGAFVIQILSLPGILEQVPLSLTLWRVVYVVVGIPALLLGIIFAVSVREPPRIVEPAARDMKALGHVMSHLGLYVPLFVGAGLSQVANFSYAAWGAEFVHRRYGWLIQDAGYAFGLAGLAAGFTGTLLAPMATQWMEKRGRPDATIWICVGGISIGGILAAIAPLTSHPSLFFVIYGVAIFCIAGAFNNAFISLQVIAPANLIATLISVQVTIVTLLGLGFGPPMVPLLDHMTGGGLGAGLSLVSVATAGPAVMLLLLARKAFIKRFMVVAR